MDPYNENIRMANEGIEMTLRTLKTVISSEPSKEDLEGYVDSLRNDMESFIQETVRLQQNRSLLQEFKRTLAKQEVSSWPEDIVGEFKKTEKKNDGKVSRKENVKAHQGMKDFEKLVAGYCKEQTDFDDDDMEVTSDIQTICPITRKEMRRPVKNLACGHVYDRDGIEGLMSQSAAMRCPVVGCGNESIVRPNNLSDDKETRRAIAKMRKH